MKSGSMKRTFFSVSGILLALLILQLIFPFTNDDGRGDPTADPEETRSYPIIKITSPEPDDELWDVAEIAFDASSSYDPDGDRLEYKWQYSRGDDIATLGEVGLFFLRLDEGDYTITLTVKDEIGNEVQEVFTITVTKYRFPRGPFERDPDNPFEPDTDGDGMPDWYEFRYKLKIDINDTHEDPDGDGYTNGQEFGDGEYRGQNLTDPMRYGGPIIINQPEEETWLDQNREVILGSFLFWISFVILVFVIFKLLRNGRGIKYRKKIKI